MLEIKSSYLNYFPLPCNWFVPGNVSIAHVKKFFTKSLCVFFTNVIACCFEFTIEISNILNCILLKVRSLYTYCSTMQFMMNDIKIILLVGHNQRLLSLSSYGQPLISYIFCHQMGYSIRGIPSQVWWILAH